MKELPILFSTPMVQANQAGIKNQTRRTQGLEKVNENPWDWLFLPSRQPDKVGVFENEETGEAFVPKPRYNVGDKIWVKETFTIIPANFLVFKADYDPEQIKTLKWKSSLFMRKEYARIWLECIDVRVERLTAISNYDATNEGILFNGERYYNYRLGLYDCFDARNSYCTLWIKINGVESLELNPWVFIYDYKLIEKP